MRSWLYLLGLCAVGIVMAQEDGGGGGGGGGEEMIEHKQQRMNSNIAHGTLMGFSFAFLFPLGAIIIRVASFKGVVWVHAAIQSLAYALVLAGMGLGVYIAVYPDSQYMASNGHPIIGSVVVAALYLQPIFAIIHHNIYRKEGRRSIWAHVHVWWGRIIVTLGIINGGLGLMLSGNTTKGEIAYGVVAGIIWLVWVGISAASAISSRGKIEGETGDKLGKSLEKNHHDTFANGNGTQVAA